MWLQNFYFYCEQRQVHLRTSTSSVPGSDLCPKSLRQSGVETSRAPAFPHLPSPEKPQTHLLLGKLLGPLHTVIVAVSLQVDIQEHTQALQLVGQELMAGPGAAQLLVAHVDLALHGLSGGEAINSALPSDWLGLTAPQEL